MAWRPGPRARMAIYGRGSGAQKLDGCNMAAIKRRSNISLGGGGGGGEINAQIAFVARAEVGPNMVKENAKAMLMQTGDTVV